MEIGNALTFVFSWGFLIVSLLFGLFKLPLLTIIFLFIGYYFIIYHIAYVVGDKDSEYHYVLKSYFILVLFTILIFSIIYYRYGLLYNNKYVEIEFSDALYFSLSTFTTLVYGDFTPIKELRVVTVIEAFFGYIMFGIWVFLISNFMTYLSKERREIREENKK